MIGSVLILRSKCFRTRYFAVSCLHAAQIGARGDHKGTAQTAKRGRHEGQMRTTTFGTGTDTLHIPLITSHTQPFPPPLSLSLSLALPLCSWPATHRATSILFHVSASSSSRAFRSSDRSATAFLRSLASTSGACSHSNSPLSTRVLSVHHRDRQRQRERERQTDRDRDRQTEREAGVAGK